MSQVVSLARQATCDAVNTALYTKLVDKLFMIEYNTLGFRGDHCPFMKAIL